MTATDLTAKRQFLDKKLSQHNANYSRHWRAGNYAGALAEAQLARTLRNSPGTIGAEALCLDRLHRSQEAYDLALTVAPERRHIDFIDLLAQLSGRLGKWEENQAYGSLALRLKNEQSAGGPIYPIPATAPPAFLHNSSVNIIAYSLFGDLARYCEGAILNCHAVATLMPAWSCRFYHDDGVPRSVLARLDEAGAQLVYVDDETRSQIPPLMWRFLVADAPEVSRFLVRDADSLVGEREKACVEAWLRSPFWFHLVRDYYTHSELLLAGLWGGCSGIFPNMRDEIVAFLARGGKHPTHYDQHFLRHHVWPTVKQSVLSHDSQFAFYNNAPLPAAEGAAFKQERHIGANLAISRFQGKSTHPDGTTLRWSLHGQDGQEICAYRTIVHNHAWDASVPITYADMVTSGQWTLRTSKVET
jgi:hypothetical protein